LPTFFPPKGGVGHGASHRQPFPVNPFQGIIGHEATLPQRQDDARRRPLLEAAMGGTTGADARLMPRMPLAARAEHEENGIHRLSILDPGPMAPQGVWFARREPRHDTLPPFVRHTPITVGFLVVFMHQ
jgi:hypothetical protein